MTNWKQTHDKLDPRIVKEFPYNLKRGSAKVLGALYVGSHSHNTYIPKEDPDSIDDTDIMGIVLPPPEEILGIRDSADWTWNKAIDELDLVFHDLRKAVRLLLNGNPNILALIWARPEDYIIRTRAMEMLIENRHLFSSQKVLTSHIGYALGQLHKMTSGTHQGYMGEKRKQLVERFGYDTKNAAHLIRLLHMGNEFADTGNLNVWRTWDAEMLRDIKRGVWSLEHVQTYAEAQKVFLEGKLANSSLPREADREAANSLVVTIVKEGLSGKL